MEKFHLSVSFDIVLIALVAHGDIAVVAAQKDLAALGHDVAVGAETGVDRGFSAAVADGLDLGDGVRQLKQPAAAGEQLRLEVRPQPEAQHRQILAVDQLAQLVDLLCGHELALIDDDDVRLFPFGVERANVLVRTDGLGLSRESHARAERELAVTVVRRGLDEPDAHAALFVVIFGDERRRGFRAAHCAVFEIQLRHCFTSSVSLFRRTGIIRNSIIPKPAVKR